MKFLFRTDASFEIGAGHFMRCFALSQRLKEDNNDIIFLTNTQNPDLLARIDKENIKLEKSIVYEELLLDAKNTVKVAQKYNTDWIITDGYKFETNYQRQIKKSGFKLMCIDDVAACHYVSDIILNQNLNAN